MAKFSGSSYIRYPGLGDSALIWLAVEIIFKPEARDGILLYNGDRNDGRGDFMAVVLDDGFVVFLMDLGSGVGLSRSVERSGRALPMESGWPGWPCAPLHSCGSNVW